MVHQIHADDLAAIEQALQKYPGGASAQQILLALAMPPPLRRMPAKRARELGN